MSFKMSGVVKLVTPKVQVSEKLSKRTIVVEDVTSMYPQPIEFTLINDKCALVDNTKIGQQVEVSFNLKGREYKSPNGETKYFNTIEAWKIWEVRGEGGALPQASQPASVPEMPEAEDDDLPF